MTERINVPTPRLRSFNIGDTVKLAGVYRTLTVSKLRDDGYVELTYNGHIAVTASAGHEVEVVK